MLELLQHAQRLVLPPNVQAPEPPNPSPIRHLPKSPESPARNTTQPYHHNPPHPASTVPGPRAVRLRSLRLTQRAQGDPGLPGSPVSNEVGGQWRLGSTAARARGSRREVRGTWRQEKISTTTSNLEVFRLRFGPGSNKTCREFPKTSASR